jgi:hypothetical protein
MSRPDGNPFMIPIMVVLILGLAGVMGYEAWSRSQKTNVVPTSVWAPRKVAPAPNNPRVAPAPTPASRKYEVFNG